MADVPDPKRLAVEAEVRSALQSPRLLERIREKMLLQSMVDLELELPKAGRRPGRTPETVYLVAALKRRLAAAGDGAEPTPIAVEIFKALGFTDEQAKNKADNLVRVFRETP